jgi:hypothetical protein
MLYLSFSPIPSFFQSTIYGAVTNLRCAVGGGSACNAARAGAANRLRGRFRGTDAPSTATASCPGETSSHLWAFIRVAGSINSLDRTRFASDGSKSASGRTELESDRGERVCGHRKSVSDGVELASDGHMLIGDRSESVAGGLQLMCECRGLVADGVSTGSVSDRIM